MSIRISLVYPTDPLGQKAGGIETFIKDFIRFSPPDFEIEFIGISSNIKNPLREWVKARLGEREFKTYYLFHDVHQNRKTFIPLSLKFTLYLALCRVRIIRRLILFNRLEPAILFIRAHLPRVVFIHNDIMSQILGEKTEVYWSKFPRLYFALENMIFKSINFIYTVNSNTFNFYIQRYKHSVNKFRFLPTWVDINRFSTTNDSKLLVRQRIIANYSFLNLNTKWVLFVGRLQEQKAPLKLINVFKKCFVMDNSICLVIIGDGNFKKKIEQEIQKLELSQRIFLMGYKSQEEILPFYQSSDVLLLTSHFEGMPRCALEALSCGLPVVTTNVGEVGRVVKNGISGEVVDSFEAEPIALAILKVLHNPKDYSANKCRDVVREYTPQIVLSHVYSKIRELYMAQH